MGSLATYFLDAVYSVTNCMVCFPSSPQLRINNRSFKIQRLLGEGGFSYVYLVQDNANQQLLALKKIRCPFGQESVSLALKEVEAYALFAPHPNIIRSIDYSVETDKSDPSAKTVYILLPYYRRGNLQDLINANLVNHTKFPERRLMALFLGVCKALKAMHQYKVKGGPGGAKSDRNAKKVRRDAARADAQAAEAMEMRPSRRNRENDDDDDQEAEGLLESEDTMAQEGIAAGAVRAYAHRDIKPGNIMIDDDGATPILMDLGSIAPSPTPITSRSLALQVQDTAAEHSTMPYRAPELFDVKTDSIIDTKVDIWSLGCTLYACLVGKSPFEARSDETGGSLSICVLGGDWRFPDEGPQRGKQKAPVPAPGDEAISDAVKDVVRRCLTLEPSERPDVDELIAVVEEVLAGLPEDGSEM
jgi:serine/threonine kinase 16